MHERLGSRSKKHTQDLIEKDWHLIEYLSHEIHLYGFDKARAYCSRYLITSAETWSYDACSQDSSQAPKVRSLFDSFCSVEKCPALILQAWDEGCQKVKYIYIFIWQ